MGLQYHAAGRWVQVLAEALAWSLTPGLGGLSGLPKAKEEQPEEGLERPDRIIHHL